MNIKQAKQEIKNTVRAYLMKEGDGAYRIPVVRQRPILLMGPPGIGKTQIMEQIARECDFDSYQDCFWDAIKSDITYEDSFLYVKDSISILQDNEKLHTKLEFVDRQKYTNDSYDVTFNLTIYNDEEHIELENQIMTMRRDKGKWVICP